MRGSGANFRRTPRSSVCDRTRSGPRHVRQTTDAASAPRVLLASFPIPLSAGIPLHTMSALTTECLSSANELLAAHNALISRIRQTQQTYRRHLKSLPSPPQALLKLPLIPSPPRSPSPSPPSSPLISSPPKPHRPDLPPAKRARLARYNNYVPEEETIRNDYSQRYVDGGEWPQNWVLGADPEHRFEE